MKPALLIVDLLFKMEIPLSHTKYPELVLVRKAISSSIPVIIFPCPFCLLTILPRYYLTLMLNRAFTGAFNRAFKLS